MIKKILVGVIGILMVSSLALASSSPSIPTAVQLAVGAAGTWTGTDGSPLYVAIDNVPNVVVSNGTITSIEKPVDIITTTTDQITVFQPTGTSLHVVIDSGVITSITNSVAVTATQLPTSLDSNGYLKVHEMATGTQRITDGLDYLAVNSDGSINVVTSSTGGTPESGYYTAVLAAGEEKAVGTYTVAGGTLYLEGFLFNLKGDADFTVKVGGSVVMVASTTATNPNVIRHLGNSYSVANGSVIVIFAKNNEAVSRTAHVSQHGTIR